MYSKINKTQIFDRLNKFERKEINLTHKYYIFINNFS